MPSNPAQAGLTVGDLIPAASTAAFTAAMDRLQARLREFAVAVDALPAEVRDLGLVFGLFGGSDAERLAAADRVAQRVGRPIHRTRWAAALAAVQEWAAQHDTTPEAEFASLVRGRRFEAVRDELGTATFWEIAADPGAAHQALRRALNRLLADDLLGPGWHRADESLDEQRTLVSRSKAHLVELDLLRRRARPKVRRLIDLLRDEPDLYWDRGELAARLGATRTNTDKLVHELKRLAQG